MMNNFSRVSEVTNMRKILFVRGWKPLPQVLDEYVGSRFSGRKLDDADLYLFPLIFYCGENTY
jgi:hypothetical protein